MVVHPYNSGSPEVGLSVILSQPPLSWVESQPGIQETSQKQTKPSKTPATTHIQIREVGVDLEFMGHPSYRLRKPGFLVVCLPWSSLPWYSDVTVETKRLCKACRLQVAPGCAVRVADQDMGTRSPARPWAVSWRWMGWALCRRTHRNHQTQRSSCLSSRGSDKGLVFWNSRLNWVGWQMSSRSL